MTKNVPVNPAVDDVPRQIAMVSQARQMLAESRSIDEVKEIRDKAEAMRLYLRQRDESLAAQNTAGEIKMWAERRAGEMLESMDRRRRDDGQSRKVSNHTTPSPSAIPTLPGLGITRDESSRFQKIASIPEDEFIEHIEETKAAQKPLTTNGVLRQAEERKQKDVADPAAAQAQRHRERFLKSIDSIEGLTCAVAAEVRHCGYGGFSAVLDNLGRHDSLVLAGTLETLIERLQAWHSQIKERFHE